MTRTWLPQDYQDEAIPPPRKSPDDWIAILPGDSYGLAPAYEDGADPRILNDGDIVLFDWTENHGRAIFTVNEDLSWSIDCDEPKAPDGGYMLVAIYGEAIDTMAEGLESFANAFIDNLSPSDLPYSDTVIFYSWSLKATKFEFRQGHFHPLEAAQ
jgi:hypothetical protein